MFEQFIGWASATVIVWIFTEAIPSADLIEFVRNWNRAAA